MSARRVLSCVFLAAGISLCALAAWHFAHGALAQRQARRELERGPVSVSKASLAIGRPLARLEIPAAGIDQVVLEGDDAATLEKGPGHVPGTALPGVPGTPNNCVIAGHRDSFFRRLGWLRKGHRIELDTPRGSFSYRVVSREVVSPRSVRVLEPTAKPRLTLITCYPFDAIGPAPDRLVVIAEPVS